jgi:glycosyltransferase involved in cell wall biosynthesis
MGMTATTGNLARFAVAPADDRDLLATSGLLDELSYRRRAGLSHDTDALTHYLQYGWLQGIEPRDGFEGEFLLPYYEAAGRSGPPALTWLELSVLRGRRAPMNRAEAESLASKIRDSAFFDAEAYARGLRTGIDPAVHYAVIGELLGWRPSQKFDPVFYLERYVDIAQACVSPLDHYIYFGQREGRRGIPAADRLRFPPLPNRQKPTVLIVVHEASRTGAPVLGWNIARRLAESYNVVSVLLRGGALEDDFSAVSAATVEPLAWDDWHPTEISRIAERLVACYRPIYAIANSIETALLVPALARLGVPSVALVHEFTAAYVRPLNKIREVMDWATHVVFPAHVVAESSYGTVPALAQRRGVHLLRQGRVELPGTHDEKGEAAAKGDLIGDLATRVRPADAADSFVVLGVGTVHLRKGVDLFLAAAATARRLAPHLLFRFVWIGDGYDPVADNGYSSYLAEQIVRSDLPETVALLNPVEDLDPAFASADVFFMCSRLDPQPNVAIEALTRGMPTVCFDGAGGTAEILSADPETRALVVPYMDAHSAAEVICRLASDPVARAAMVKATARVAASAYDMEAYVRQVDEWGLAAAAALRTEDLQTLVDAKVIDPDLALPNGAMAPGAFGVERHVLHQWTVVGTSLDQTSNPHFRRPCAGFHPQVYARAHPDVCGDGGENPLAHWLRAGRPSGRWSRRVFSPLDALRESASVRLALHAHFYYVLHAGELAARLAGNVTRCDLFLSTDTNTKAAQLRTAFAGHAGTVNIRVMPNRGRDIGPFLTGFAPEIVSGGYDVFGHVHAKQSTGVEAAMGDLWREFLWENLIGGEYPMLDVAASAFAAEQDMGLLIAEDPHLVGWDENRAIAETLAVRMGLDLPLDDFFDFPLGNMFWARPSALAPLLALDLAWDDYPAEPIANDGTLMHALERMSPYSARVAGLSVAGLRAPGTTW